MAQRILKAGIRDWFEKQGYEQRVVDKKVGDQEEKLFIDDDIDFKPGIYKQIEAFFKNHEKLLTIQEQIKHLETYSKIKG